jgi:triacylglycerol lipase
MPFTNTVAASYGLLAMHAMDMYRVNTNALTPPEAPGLTAAGWSVAAYIIGRDAIFAKGPLQVAVRQVCYGFLAKRGAGAAQEWVAVIRGTDGIVEWIEDAEFAPMTYPAAAGAPGAPSVEQGFWSIYATMQLIDTSGAAIGSLASAIATLVARTPGPVTVVGHSLGSALATYLALELARGALGKSVSACLFASPRTGNQDFVTLFDSHVADYRLFNYLLDLVPRVPLGLGYQPLPRRTVIQPGTAEANVRVDPGCNHHVICYCAMLDYEGTMTATTPTPAGEEGSKACIRGPETGKPSIAKDIVDAIAGTVPV